MSFLTHLTASIAIAVSSLFGTAPSITPAPTSANVEQHTQAQVSTYTSEGNYSSWGQCVSYSLQFPAQGGEVNGSFNGACNGTVNGNFTQTNSTLTGTVSGHCENTFYKGDFSQGYTGVVNESRSSVHVSVNSESSMVQRFGQADLPLSGR
jgi:hypothetical protein